MSELPDGWAEAELGDIVPPDAPIIYGILQPGPNLPDGVSYVRPTEIVNDVIDAANLRRTSAEIAARYRRSTLKPDDVILSIVGTIGKVAIVPMALDGSNITQSSCRVRPDTSIVLRDTVAHFLRSPAASSQFDDLSLGTAVPRLNLEDVRKVSLPIPPLPEQQRIAAKIGSLSAKSKRARDHLDHIPRMVEKYKQAILAAAFRGELTREWRARYPAQKWSSQRLAELDERRKDYLRERRGSRLQLSAANSEELSSMPQGWFSAHLADVGTLQVGYAYKSKWYSKHGTRLLRGANIAPGEVTWSEVVCLPPDQTAKFSQYALNAGDIVIAMDRPVISTGLKVARIEPSDAGCLLVQRVARYVPSSFAENTFVWYLINSQGFIDHAVSQATGSDLPHISSNDILTTPLPLPALAEQREIVRRIEIAFGWIKRLASEATSARKLIDHLDQAVLAKAFRGELVPQDPNDEPASVLLERIRAERATVAPIKRGSNAPARKGKPSSI